MKHRTDERPSRCSTGSLILAALAIVGAGGARARATIQLNVTRVGFPALPGENVVRSGAWTTVVVDLDIEDRPAFDGSLRVGQFDADGDEVFDRVEVHLRAETGGAQRYFLYALANPRRNQDRFVVELFDDQGEAVQVASQGELTYQASPAQNPRTIADDDLLILSVSSAAVGRIQDLVGTVQRDLFFRPVHVGHLGPTDLPEHWIGLETVDYIVWEDARAEELSERQIAAVVNWVQQGGTLLIAASRTAGSLRQVPAINNILPAEPGEVVSVDNLPDLRRALLGDESRDETQRRSETVEWWNDAYPQPVPVVPCTVRDGAQRLPKKVTAGPTLIAGHRVGRGRVIFCGVTLKDFFSGSGSPNDFFRHFFQLRVVSGDNRNAPAPRSLFETVASAVSFIKSGTIYLFLAGAFSLVYVATATIGSWFVLGTRGWRRHSWSAFAVVAMAASVLSVFIVNAIRGFGSEKLDQISIVDLDAGNGYGYATAFFGLKTGVDRQLDLWLPSDAISATDPGVSDCFLRPIPASNDLNDTSAGFADPEEYRVTPASAIVNGVRLRATLKRFEGRWEGTLGGTVTGEVTVRDNEIAEGSYVVNSLGVDLQDCYLIQTVLDATDFGTARDGAIYAHPIGALPADGRRLDLAAACYKTTGQETKEQVRNKHRLDEIQRGWEAKISSGLRGLRYGLPSQTSLVPGQEKNALMLASTVGEYEPTPPSPTQAWLSYETWSRDRLRQLDLRDQLTRDAVILIGFADAPGPARLFRRIGDRDWRMLEPNPAKSWTMYRVRIPAKLVGGSIRKEQTTTPE